MNDSPEVLGQTGDPLAMFLAELTHELAEFKKGGRAFEAFEHVWLGNAGLHRACAELGEEPLDHIRTRRGKGGDDISYGEIVALSGDFYANPDALFYQEESYLPWFFSRKDIGKLRAMIAEEVEWSEGDRRVPYPDNNLLYMWSAKKYVELALANVVHFGWHNVLAYCKHHADALNLALWAHRTGDEAVWRRAIYTNGFADHFLTDAFAAGHIRVPRAQTIGWAQEKGWSEQLAGALSMLLHDQDGHIHTAHGEGGHADPEDALYVRNSRGDAWFTRCDGQLLLGAPDDPAVQQPVAAVAESFKELLWAYRRGEVPTEHEVFTALLYVPFPHPDGQKLIEKFPAEISGPALDRLMSRARWFSTLRIPMLAPGMTEDHVRIYLSALPEIMERFRADVAATDHPLLGRLPPAYVEAFRQIA